MAQGDGATIRIDARIVVRQTELPQHRETLCRESFIELDDLEGVEFEAGHSSGTPLPTPGYFKGVRELCDRYGILFIADEVMCGMGRTGSLFAVEQENVVPDLVTIAKGLGGGFQPVGAFLAQSKIIDAIREGSGLFQHGHTYIGHPVACAAALAVQKVIQRDDLVTAVRQKGAYLRQLLSERFGDHPNVGDIRGRGFFMSLEFVQERARKTTFDPSLKLHARIKSQAMRNGLLVYPMGGTIDGRNGDHVLLAPPFIATKADLEQIVDLLAVSIQQAIDSTVQS